MGKWCLHASLFIFDRIIIQVAVTRTGVKARSSWILGGIRLLILELLALEWRKFHTFELEYLWSQLANLDQILCVASLGWGKGCIRFWDRLTLAHWTQVSDRCPLGYLLLIWTSVIYCVFFLSGSTLWKLCHSNPNQLNFRYRNIRDIPPSVWRYNETPFEILYLCEQNVTWSGNAVFCETSCRLSRHR